MEAIAEMITNFGFPIVLTFCLLFRTEKKIEQLTQTIAELNQLIKQGIS